MVRPRRLTSDDVFQPLGDVVLGLIAVPFFVGIFALLAAAVVVCLAFNLCEWLQKQRVLGPVAFAGIVVVVLLHFTGCSTAPVRDPRDPEVWRPAAPANYPLPR